MNNPFFIMMYSHTGLLAMPIVGDDGEVRFFPSEEVARDAVADHPFCQQFGYEIFEMGTGA